MVLSDVVCLIMSVLSTMLFPSYAPFSTVIGGGVSFSSLFILVLFNFGFLF